MVSVIWFSHQLLLLQYKWQRVVWVRAERHHWELLLPALITSHYRGSALHGGRWADVGWLRLIITWVIGGLSVGRVAWHWNVSDHCTCCLEVCWRWNIRVNDQSWFWAGSLCSNAFAFFLRRVHRHHGNHRIIMLIRHLAKRMAWLMELHAVIIAHLWLIKYHVVAMVFNPVGVYCRGLMVVGSSSSLARMPRRMWFVVVLVACLFLSAHEVLGLVESRNAGMMFFLAVLVLSLFV